MGSVKYGQKLYFTAKDENGEPIDLTAREVIAHAKIGDYPKKNIPMYHRKNTTLK